MTVDLSAHEIRKRGVVLLEIPVLWQGWECDDKAWVVECDGERHLITTNHGGLRAGEVDMLREKIEEYRKAIEITEKALDLLE